MRRQRFLLAAGVIALAVGAVLGIGYATAADPVNHGISFTKGCASPTNVGQPYSCSYSIRNNVDDAQDTLTINGLTDVVHSSGGDVPSGNVFSQLRFVVGPFQPGFSKPPTCTGGTGNGTDASPWTGATSCSLPFGSRINVLSFSFYTVTAADFNNAGHRLTDAANLTWHDTCDDFANTGNSNCAANPPTVAAASQTIVTQSSATTTTDIHNAQHQIVTVVPAGATVHDSATVSAPAGSPTPTGNVVFDWFTNNGCEGQPASTSAPFELVNGTVDAVSFAKGPLAAGFYGFRAHYQGNGLYGGSDGLCEPLRVVDANVQITPNGVNRVGQTHVFTAHANVNDGGGFVNAPDGTTISFTVNGAASGTCTTAGGTGSCSIGLTSAVTGLWAVNASATLSVGGLTLTRTTDGMGGNSGAAMKRWVNAKISITPTATNIVGQPHTFVVTLQKDIGDGNGFGAASGEHVDVTLTDSNGANHTAPTGTCTQAGANTDAAGTCTITFNSATPGKVTGHAASTIAVAGSAPFTVQTDGQGLNSGDAVKTYVDANIQITPSTATNRVGAEHVFTAHVNVNNGNGQGFQNAPDGTQISFTKVSGPGSFSTANPCTVTGGTGSCQITLNSGTTGVTTVSASTTLSVGGLSVTRTTNGVGASSGPAVKTWVNARIAITPNATNPIGQPHTFTVTLEKDTGTGTFVPAAGEHVGFTLTDSNGAGSVLNAPGSTCDDAGANTDANGQCTIVFSSATAGKVTGHAFATLSLGTPATVVTVATDGTAGNSVDAVKTYVDANIQITPPTATNRVGTNHVFTAHVNVNDGTGGFQNAPAGTQISFTIDSGPGTLTTANPCTTTGTTGSCQITLTSNVTGVTTVSAHTTVSVGGVSLTRHTNGAGANSNPALKTWVNARIMIAPNATNAVGDAHTFTVTLQKDTGTGAFVPAGGEHVTVNLTNSAGAGFVLDAATSTCDNAGPNTDGNGQCTMVFTSPTPGKVTAHASSTLAIGTPPTNVTVETDGVGGNSGDAVKTFVDANIQITPAEATNRVGVNHVFTAHVNVDNGTGAGFQNAPDGTQISFTLDSGPGTLTTANPCTTTGGTGSCQITLASSTTGVTIVSAHTTVSVGGIALTRHTNGTGANSGPAQKTWVNGRIMIAPDATNQVGQSHTFMVTLFKDTGTGIFVPAANEHVDVTLTPTNGAAVINPTGTCLQAGANTDANGQCSITFTSNSTGKVTAHAISSLTIGTPPTTFTVQTDGLILNSGDAVKTFVNARISIAPDATNEVGQPHTFTVTLQKDPGTGTFEAAAGEHVSFTLTGANGAVAVLNAASSTCDNTGANTDANGQCVIVFNSASPGKVTGHASATLLVGPPPPAPITVATDGTGLNSADAVKTYVDANIQITPPVATNQVGQVHTFTAHVNVNDGNGGFQNAPDGTQISFTIDGGPGSFTSPNPCVTSGGTGNCTITLSSATTGTTVVSAHTNVMVGGLNLHRDTNGVGANSSPANKTWVNARIAIAPNATNEVGQPHTFTVTLLEDTGTGTFVAAANEHVNVTLTDTNGATHTAPTGTCTAPGANTNSAGQCTITFTSPTAGKVTGHASATLSIGTPATSVTVQTDGVGLNSGNAVKTFVDANIQINPPTALNPVNTNHVFTAHMNVNAGDGLGYVNAPAGTQITFTKTSGPGNLTTVNPCLTVGTTGSCTITLTSSVTGTSVVSASGTATLAGLQVTRTTNGQGQNSGPAQKTWGSAQISIAPDATNEVGVPHTFTVTLTKDNGSGVQMPAANEHVDFTLTNSNGASAVLDTVASTCDNTGPNTNAQGQCTIVFVSATAGKVTGHAFSTLPVGGVSTTVQTPVDAVKTYVDANIQITPNGTNPIGTTHTFTAHVNINRGDGNGFVNAPADTTITFTKDSGPGSFTSPSACTTVGTTGSCTATITSATAGSTVVSAHVTTSVGNVSLTRHTNGAGANSGPATKVWLAARISITPNATNEIGHAHTFTVTLEKDSGSGFAPAANEHVTVTLTPSNGATLPTPASGTCTNSGVNTNAQGQCTITFVSPTAGKVTGRAAATLQVGGLPLTVETDGQNGNSADAVKTFVDANIQITPANATNRVNAPHTFTAHVNVNNGGGSFANAPDGTVVNFAINGSASGSCTTAGGTGSCSITRTSSTTGVWTVVASTTVTVGGVNLSRSTNGVAPNSGPAVKTWVNAKISITPSATNRVGQPHTFTVTLQKDTGNGAGFVAAAGETVTVTLTNSNGAVASPAGPFTGTTNASGQFQVTFNSQTTGKVTGHASSTLSIGSPATSFTVQTDGTGLNSGDAVKTYVDARISITPNATNEVGQPHTFTVTLTKDTGTGSFVPAQGEHVDVTLTNSNGAASTSPTGTCTTSGANTNASGQCTITFTSPTAGKVTGHATASLTIGGVAITVQTNGQAGNSVDAVKTFVDANIQITPQTDSNPVGTNHVFTAHVNVNAGDGNGFVNAPAGTSITFTKVSGPGSFTTANPCTTAGTTGSCTITLTSSTSGTTVVGASTTLSAGGLTLTRTTNGSSGNSGNASKVWLNARISITPNATNEVGQPHTFTVTLEKDTGSGFGPAAGEHVTATLTPSNGATLPGSPTGTCTNSGANTNASGQCTITFVSPTAGKVTGNASATLTVGGLPLTVSTNGQNGNSGPAVKTFVDANIQIDPPTATNNLGDPHVFTAHVNVNAGAGSFANAPAGTVITFTKVSGPGTLSASSCTTVGTTGSCDVTLTNSTTTGTTVVRASTTITVGGKSLTRSTSDGKPGDSADATKIWQKCIPATFTLTGNTSSTGSNGNIRTFTASNNVQVKASAFNRASNGSWTTAYLGSYSSGLGVTNRTEDGSDPSHKVDNVGSVDYVLFEFATPVAVDQAVLEAVTGDSDITVWIGNKTDPFNNHQTLSDSFLSSLGFTEVNLAPSSASRTADINAGAVEGNILVIAAKTDETTDQFKIKQLKTACPTDCVPGSFTLTGNTSSTGTNGNIRTFTANNAVQVKASAFNRASNGSWTTAYLGSYSSGLGVTNRTEDGSDPSHKVDNVGSVDYVLFEFSAPVVVDKAVLEAITDDSDIRVWIGNKTNPFNNHQTLSDSFLSSLGFTEENLTSSSSSRTADVNAGGVEGNILVIAAETDDSSPSDQFKIKELKTSCPDGCIPGTVETTGNTSSTGTNGNIRTFTASNGVQVKASAFNRTGGGTWTTAYLGAYSPGLGVTNKNENGSDPSHKVDNVDSVDYVLFEFSSPVVVDQALLDAVTTDSDITVWIGNKTDPFNNHQTLSDSFLNGLGFTEENVTSSSSSRTADINAGGVEGNILVIAAQASDTSPEDQFKIHGLDLRCP